MRIVRYQIKDEAPRCGLIMEGEIKPIEGSIFGDYRRMGPGVPVGSVRLLAPAEPGKIICLGRNYAEHAREHGSDVPKVPLIFMKPPSSIINPGDKIVLPPQSQQVEHEAELVVVIGRRGRHIAAGEARGYILGYTIGNDATARDLQRSDGQWTRAKSFDTFCPFGPWIDTEFDPSDALIACTVNGAVRQKASTREMIFKVDTLVAFISSVMTLEAGDLIFTGTPAGVGPLKPGDVVEVEIQGLGKLSNPVAAQA
ncbi:MAG: fumarylacetoacetate hydrolase family protein [Candidatus Eisenbacteria bacterium]|nr:fumarylacetoacetate hydrolase family protein [Candidatus Eisenbacteria bacterium]